MSEIKKLSFQEGKEIIYERNGKKYTRQQLEEKYGAKVDDAIANLGFSEVKERMEPAQEYEYQGKKFTRQQLEDKYGDKVEEAISSIGFKDVSPAQEFDNAGNVQETPVAEQPANEPVKKKENAELSSQDPALASSGNTKVIPGSSELENPDASVAGVAPQPEESKPEPRIVVPKEGDEKEVGFFEDLYNEAVSGVTRTLAGAYGIKNFLNKQEAALFLSFMPDKYSEALNDMSPKQREKFINNAVNQSSPIGRVMGEFSYEAQDALTEKTNEVAKRTIQFEGNIIDDVSNGNFAQAGRRTLKGVVNSASSIALAVAPGGLAVIGAGTASQKQEELEAEGEDLNVRTVLNSTINGAAEGIMERYTGKIAGSALKSFKGKPEAAKEFSESIITTILKDIGMESGSEGATSLIQDLSDRLVQGRDVSWTQIMKNAADGAIIGGAMGGGMSAPKALSGYVASKSMKKEKQNAINNKTAEAINIEEQLDNPDIDEALKKVLSKKAAKLRTEVQTIQDGEVARAESMTDQEVKDVFQAEKDYLDLNDEVLNLMENQSIDPVQKEKLLSVLKDELNAREKRSENLKKSQFEKLPMDVREQYIEEAKKQSKEYLKDKEAVPEHIIWAAERTYFDQLKKHEALGKPNSETKTPEEKVKDQHKAETAENNFLAEVPLENTNTANTKASTISNATEVNQSSELYSEQSRSNALTNQRIKPERRQPHKKPLKLNDIIRDVSKDLKSTLIYSRSGRARSLGSYNPSNALVRISRAGDLDTVAHELGHYLDDRFNVVGEIPSDLELATVRQLKWFSDRGGSNPPAKLSKEQKRNYLQREGLAEFVRGYIANPEQTKIVAPELYQHFENTVGDKTIKSLQEFSNDYLDFANATNGEKIISNVESSNLKDKNGFREWMDKFKGSDGQLNITPFDKINAHLLNSMGIAEKAFSFLTDISGKTNLKPSENFEIMSRVFAGINGKVHRVLTTGLVNEKNETITDSKGDTMNVKWLLEPLENTNEKTVTKEMDEVIQLLVAERTMEYAKKFQRLDDLTGIGGGIAQDIEIAQGFLAEFKELKQTNKEKYDRIKEASRRYREFADAGLKYAVGKGRISADDYLTIKENNEYYAALTRIQENAPVEEALDFVNKRGSNISSAREIIQKAKGGTGFIQNPYLSLLQNTVAIIKESDRNEVMQSFVEPIINSVRIMGDGTPIDFAQVARPAQTGDKNTRAIYVDGQRQTWQFAPDIYESLTSLEAVAKNPIVDILAKPADLIRFTVTRFPTFALRNAVRDTISRMVVSRTNSKFKDLIHNADDKALFEMYGGSQAGFYLVNKKAYRETLRKTVKEITNKGGVVLDPRRLGTKYFELLERGENLNRIAEFKSAHRKAKKEGLNDYDAGLYAAYQARDLMDFAVAGHTVRVLNKMMPFFNAGIQAVRRTGRAIKENPGGFAVRTAIYTFLPQIAVRILNELQGDDEEYEQLPAYQRDLFWNFKIPALGDHWITIPKPFEQGLTSSGVDRIYSKARGNEDAFEGFGGSVANMLMPYDESSMMMGAKPIIEASVNYNTFTERPIVPQWEEGKLLELRKGKEKASRAGEGISYAFDKAGMSVDPRKIDHVIQGYGTYMANWGLSLSDLGVEDSRFKFNISKTGFARDVPMSNSVAVSGVYELATELGKWNDTRLNSLRNDIEKFYDSEDKKERKELTQKIYSKAEKLRKEFKKEKKEIQEPEKKKKRTNTGPTIKY